MKKLFYPCLALIFFACTENNKPAETTGYSAEGKKITSYTTADSTEYRLSPVGMLEFKQKGQPAESEVTVFIDPSKTFQTYFGTGAALTDASAETFYKLPKDKQQEFLKAYFDKEKGIGYTLGRTNINSCDFSSDMYTYVQDEDKDLRSFSIEHDKKYKIPFIKEAIKAAGGKLNLFASPAWDGWETPVGKRSVAFD